MEIAPGWKRRAHASRELSPSAHAPCLPGARVGRKRSARPPPGDRGCVVFRRMADAPLRLLLGGGRSGISAQLGSSRVSGLAILRSAPATAGRTRRAERPVPLRALGFIPPGSPAPSPRLEPLHGASGSRRGLGAVSRTTASPPPHRALDPERPPLQRGLGKHTPGPEGGGVGSGSPTICPRSAHPSPSALRGGTAGAQRRPGWGSSGPSG